jgi:hypothetical protein
MADPVPPSPALQTALEIPHQVQNNRECVWKDALKFPFGEGVDLDEVQRRGRDLTRQSPLHAASQHPVNLASSIDTPLSRGEFLHRPVIAGIDPPSPEFSTACGISSQHAAPGVRKRVSEMQKIFANLFLFFHQQVSI